MWKERFKDLASRTELLVRLHNSTKNELQECRHEVRSLELLREARDQEITRLKEQCALADQDKESMRIALESARSKNRQMQAEKQKDMAPLVERISQLERQLDSSELHRELVAEREAKNSLEKKCRRLTQKVKDAEALHVTRTPELTEPVVMPRKRKREASAVHEQENKGWKKEKNQLLAKIARLERELARKTEEEDAMTRQLVEDMFDDFESAVQSDNEVVFDKSPSSIDEENNSGLSDKIKLLERTHAHQLNLLQERIDLLSHMSLGRLNLLERLFQAETRAGLRTGY